MEFERGRRDPLLAPRIFARAGAALGPAVMRGGFNRTSALRIPGTRLFRIGNPFIDMLGNTIVIDDRGQASVFLRRDARVRGEPQVYFGLDFLVEADITAALKVAGNDRETQYAVDRQADRIFEPFMRRVWVRAGDDKAVDHLGLVDWLDRPYVPDRERLQPQPHPDRSPLRPVWRDGRVRGRGAGRRDDQPP